MADSIITITEDNFDAEVTQSSVPVGRLGAARANN